MGNGDGLKDKLRHQRSLVDSSKLANQLARGGLLRLFQAGDTLFKEGAPARSIFFILHGCLNIDVKGKRVAQRTAGRTVGELAAIDPARPRSATVSADTDTTVLEVHIDKLERLAKRDGSFYRHLARDVADRLRERDQFIQASNTVPHVLFLSSSESFSAIELLSDLTTAATPAICRTWKSPDVFVPGDYPLTSLLEQLNKCDFAVALASGDDLRRRKSTGEERASPRDNILLEIGLFIGRLGSKRTLVLDPTSGEITPSDLKGVTAIRYTAAENGFTPIAPVELCASITNQIKLLGPIRTIPTHS